MNNTVDCNDTTGECLCIKGWGGVDCDEDVDDCLNPLYCLDDNEVCLNSNGSAECKCDIGFERLAYNSSCEG